jgi:ParB family chromosome partitioning protein
MMTAKQKAISSRLPDHTNADVWRKADLLEAKRFDIRGTAKTFRTIPVEQLKPGLYQTRKNFKPQTIKELALSLESTGTNFTPLIVRPLKYADGYEIICGERRWRGAQLIGMPGLLCCVGDFTDEQALYLSGADNIQREGLNPLEEAYSYELLLHSGLTHEEVAKEIGKSRTHVTNHLRLLSLPLPIRDMLVDERLSYAQARPLCGLSSVGDQLRIAKEAVTKRWAARKIEEEVRKLRDRKRAAPRAGAVEDVDIKRLKEVVAEQTGYQCAIIKTERGGWQIGFNASSTEEFQGILDRLGVNTEML